MKTTSAKPKAPKAAPKPRAPKKAAPELRQSEPTTPPATQSEPAASTASMPAAYQDPECIAQMTSPDFPTLCSFPLFRQLFCEGAGVHDSFKCYLQMRHTKLNPFLSQIYFKEGQHGWEPVIPQVGMRLLAERTGERAGDLPAEWCGTDGVWMNQWNKPHPPIAARVCVKRRTSEYWATVHLCELDQGVWDPELKLHVPSPASERPIGQLARSAESAALRKAFPDQIGNARSLEDFQKKRSEGYHTIAEQFQSGRLHIPARDPEPPAPTRPLDREDSLNWAVESAEKSWPSHGSGWGIDQPAPPRTMAEAVAPLTVAQSVLQTEAGQRVSGKMVTLFEDPSRRLAFLRSEKIGSLQEIELEHLPGLERWLNFLSLARLRGLNDRQASDLADYWRLSAPRWRSPEHTDERCEDLQKISDQALKDQLQRAGIA